jgi:hypothetical protein
LIVKTLSASSLSNWEECPAKFGAVNSEFTPEYGNKGPAKVGTSVHYALEHGVRMVYLDKTHQWEEKLFLELYDKGYAETFGSFNKRTAEYKDGLALVKAWFKRTDLSGWEVLAVEDKKRHYIFPGRELESDQPLGLTYIFDRIQRRVDEHGRKILKVVDYKSERRMYSYEELRDKLQVRIYGLAAAIEFKATGWIPDIIEVELDMLRFDPIGVEITRDDNVETWDYLQATALAIAEADPENLPERVGKGCRYCPRASTCGSLQKHVAAGGILSYENMDDLIARRREWDAARAALEQLVAQADEQIVDYAEKEMVNKFESRGFPVTVQASTRRDLKSMEEAASIIGPDLMARYGKLNLGNVDELLDSEELSKNQKLLLSQLIYKKPTKISVKVSEPKIIKPKGA